MEKKKPQKERKGKYRSQREREIWITRGSGLAREWEVKGIAWHFRTEETGPWHSKVHHKANTQRGTTGALISGWICKICQQNRSGTSWIWYTSSIWFMYILKPSNLYYTFIKTSMSGQVGKWSGRKKNSINNNNEKTVSKEMFISLLPMVTQAAVTGTKAGPWGRCQGQRRWGK